MMALQEILYYKVFLLFVFSGVAFSQSEEVLFDDLSGRVDELILRIDRLNSITNQKPLKTEVLSSKLTSSSDILGSDKDENVSPSMTLPNQLHNSAFENLEPRVDELLNRLDALEKRKFKLIPPNKKTRVSFDMKNESFDLPTEFKREFLGDDQLDTIEDNVLPLKLNTELSDDLDSPSPEINDSDKLPAPEMIVNGFKSRKKSQFFESEKEHLTPLLDSQPKEWDLLVLRELALSSCPSILVKKAEVDVLKGQIPVTEFEYFPTLTARAGIDNYAKIAQFQTYSEPEPYSVFSYGLDARWTLYDGFKTRKKLSTARLEINKAEKDLILEEQNILRKLIEHYFKVLETNVELAFLPQIEEIKDLRTAIYTRQLKAGIINRMFIDTINRELESLRLQKMNAEVSRESALNEMSFLLNVKEGFWSTYKKFKVPPEVTVVESLDYENSVYGNVGDAGIEVAKSKYSEIESESSPQVFINSNTGYRGRNRIGFESQGHEMTIGLNVEFPISARFLNKRKLQKARKEILRSEIEKERLLSQHENQFASEKLKLDLAYKTQEFHSELLALQRKKLEDVRMVSAQGISDKSSILFEQEELLKREMVLRQSELNCLKQKYILYLIE
jgi:outer membrane protein TolC